MKFAHPVLFAVSVSLMAMAGNVFAEDSADDAMEKCRAAASEDQIPSSELTGYLRQCLSNAGVSQQEIDVRTGQGGPGSDASEAAPATESSD